MEFNTLFPLGLSAFTTFALCTSNSIRRDRGDVYRWSPMLSVSVAVSAVFLYKVLEMFYQVDAMLVFYSCALTILIQLTDKLHEHAIAFPCNFMRRAAKLEEFFLIFFALNWFMHCTVTV